MLSLICGLFNSDNSSGTSATMCKVIVLYLKKVKPRMQIYLFIFSFLGGFRGIFFLFYECRFIYNLLVYALLPSGEEIKDVYGCWTFG